MFFHNTTPASYQRRAARAVRPNNRATNASTPRTISLPGFGLPVDTLEDWSRSGEQTRLPHAIADNFDSAGITFRERRMLEFMDQITDKPLWNQKVFDEEIVAKWRAEAIRWDETLPEKGDWWLSEEMFAVCMLELREKAQKFEETGFVAVLDAEATIVKSDGNVSQPLRDELKEAVRPLEHVPYQMKDFHPNTGEQVLDLVHPSLYPVVYGLSRALPTGTVPLESCLSYIGKGETIPAFSASSYHKESWVDETDVENAWGSYQWLPSNIKFAEDGTAKIDSYINNLHPEKHGALYKVLGRFVDAAIPLWNECLSHFHSRLRIKLKRTSDEDYIIPEGIRFPRHEYRDGDEEDASDDEEEDDRRWCCTHDHDDEYADWHREHRILTQPEPKFTPQSETANRPGARPIDLRKDGFGTNGPHGGIQVIFKLATIQLTPDEPTYAGGSWHVEGSLNEHICATALYYYDSENVTNSRLAFRQNYDREIMTNMPSEVPAYFNVAQEQTTILHLGSILTRPNRLLVFPNVFQHQLQPFSLTDPSKPGHRKILALFLVDPYIPILSTANVPPQRRDWWVEEVRRIEPFVGLPEEPFVMIMRAVFDEGDGGFLMSGAEAQRVREELMGERSGLRNDLVDTMESLNFNFCEH